MKKFFVLLTACMILISFTACKKSNKAVSSKGQVTQSTATTTTATTSTENTTQSKSECTTLPTTQNVTTSRTDRPQVTQAPVTQKKPTTTAPKVTQRPQTTDVEISNAEKTGSIKVTKATRTMKDIVNITFILHGTSDSGRDILIETSTDSQGIAEFKNVAPHAGAWIEIFF